MTTSAAELAELRDAVRRALRVEPDAVPEIDRQWRSGWPALAGIGLLAFCAAEHVGGFGNEVPAALLVSRELGAALHGSPYAASVAAAYALSRARSADPATGALLEAVLAGEQLTVLGALDHDAAVVVEGAEARVTGAARLVAGAEDADAILLVTADGSVAILVECEAGTVGSVHDFDVSRSCGDIAFDDAPARVVDVPDGTLAIAMQLHGLLLAGDALGGLEVMHARTTAYARERRAFGNVIGGFQAVQHRLVDHAVRIRGLSLLADDGAERLASGAPGAERQVLLAEAGVARHAVTILHDLLQLTGAIGFTWEYGLHLYERRAHVDARLGRAPRWALGRLAACEGWSGA